MEKVRSEMSSNLSETDIKQIKRITDKINDALKL